MHCYKILHKHWVGLRSSDCKGHSVWISFADCMCCSRDQQIISVTPPLILHMVFVVWFCLTVLGLLVCSKFTAMLNSEQWTQMDKNTTDLRSEIIKLTLQVMSNCAVCLISSTSFILLYSHWKTSMRSDLFDCKFTSDGFSCIPSSSHPWFFTHLCIYQSILPLGPLMMIGPHCSPIDLLSLSPIRPSGPLGSDASPL